ncbi:MAG: ExbD/TolR family protein [Bacteroidota bacterium]
MNLGSRNKVNAEASMSSMTDLVFLMLIFFVILATLVNDNPQLNVDLPTANSSATSFRAKVTITIDANQQHFVNSTPVKAEEVEALVNQKLSEPNVEPTIEINVDKSVPTGLTVAMLDIAKKNHWKIALATQHSN